MLLREYAAALRGALTGTRADELLTDVASRRIASADLEAIAKDLESWVERDWIAVIDIGPAREHLIGLKSSKPKSREPADDPPGSCPTSLRGHHRRAP